MTRQDMHNTPTPSLITWRDINSRRQSIVQEVRLIWQEPYRGGFDEAAQNIHRPEWALLEGEHLIEEALIAGLELKAAFASTHRFERSHTLMHKCHAQWPEAVFYRCEPMVMDFMCSVTTAPPVMALMRRPSFKPLEDLRGDPHDVMILDGVQDPGNAGTMIRLAAALGLPWVIGTPQTVSLWHPKVLRASQGAHFQLSIAEDVEIKRLIGALPNKPLTIATMEDDDALPMHTINLKTPRLWLFGQEGQGVSATALAFGHDKVSIPMPSNKTESLNVAISAAILLYEQFRQRSSGQADIQENIIDRAAPPPKKTTRRVK